MVHCLQEQLSFQSVHTAARKFKPLKQILFHFNRFNRNKTKKWLVNLYSIILQMLILKTVAGLLLTARTRLRLVHQYGDELKYILKK